MEKELLLRLYRQMLLMRRFEEAAAQAYTQRKIGGFLHLYIGQEAVGTGVVGAMRPEDYVITTYRCHGQYLARGGTARQGMAELYGKATGCSQGLGGSMHFFDAEKHMLGGHGIVGAHVPVAAGIAFAAKYKKEKSVCVCFLGEGATSIGPFHEGLCLASLWGLPVVYIIENNQFAMGTPQFRQMKAKDTSIRALAYPMARETIESTDIVECYDAAKKAIDWSRKEQQPFLMEFKTYRYRGHSMADPAKYRTKEELEEKKKHDPILVAEQRILKDYPEAKDYIEKFKQEVEDEVMDAVKFAEESPDPDPSLISKYTYV